VATSWTVAMHPGEGSFASSGAGGRVYVRDAKASETGGEEGEGFGEEMRAMDTGKGKFGMNLQYVCSLSSLESVRSIEMNARAEHPSLIFYVVLEP
jgi:hypothetical protein